MFVVAFTRSKLEMHIANDKCPCVYCCLCIVVSHIVLLQIYRGPMASTTRIYQHTLICYEACCVVRGSCFEILKKQLTFHSDHYV